MTEVPIEVDLAETSDEDYQSGGESSTASLSSTIFSYEYENGRRYHAYKAGAYALPNDETEQDRLDVMHHIFNMLLGGRLYVAPLDRPQRILDIGTGTGIWAIDIADQFPEAEVIGTDLSPIQPKWIPPNLHFQIDDCELDWTFEKDSFDYIHIRGLQGSVKDWPRLLTQAYLHLKPGGFIEVDEWADGRGVTDDGTDKGSAISTYYDRLNEAADKIGRPFHLSTPLKEMIPAAGFVNYHQTVHKLPVSPWPADQKLKLIGRWFLSSMESGYEAYGLALFTRVLNMDPKEAKELCAAAWKDVQGRKVHMYANTYFAYAQKPWQ